MLIKASDMPRRKSDEIDARIGTNLFDIRLQAGVTREQLGNSLHTRLSPQAIIKYENGKTRIPAATLVELSRLFKCKLTKFFDGVEELLPSNITALPDQQPALTNITNALIIDIARKE